MHEHYLIELLETTRQTVSRMSARMNQAESEDRETLRLILSELTKIEHDIAPPPPPPPPPPATLSRSSAVQFTSPV